MNDDKVPLGFASMVFVARLISVDETWHIAQSNGEATQLSRNLGLPSAISQILVQRGITEAGEAETFLNPRLGNLSDPLRLPDMDKAVERILLAIKERQSVALFGDYDVDGISSVALLQKALHAYEIDVSAYLPSRMAEGYGLTQMGLERCLAEAQPRLLIAIDCGTNSREEVAWLKERGVDVIILDHHEPQGPPPCAVARVNPKLGTEHTYLCSAGVVFKVVHALLRQASVDCFRLKDHLDLVALGTVADLAPMRGENRILTRAGLACMPQSHSEGLRALLHRSGVVGRLKSSDISFRLGPRLNAAGRLGAANDALALLMANNATDANLLAERLEMQNRERQDIEATTFAAAEILAEADIEIQSPAVVVGAPDWHPGVVGIVASRLCRAFHRPAFVVAFDEEGMGRGSARSLEHLCLVQALDSCRDCLDKYGGHSQAAGFSVAADRFDEFKMKLLEIIATLASSRSLTPRLQLDAEVTLADLDREFIDVHDALGPFGMQNEQPLLLSRGVTPVFEPQRIKNKHWRIMLTQGQGGIDSIFFNAPEKLPAPPWQVAFHLEINEWKPHRPPQLYLKAIRAENEPIYRTS
ncbi:MAG: single-stranded-DNA-specific exonuclease RecJ [Verrucomicrobiales bacterium]